MVVVLCVAVLFVRFYQSNGQSTTNIYLHMKAALVQAENIQAENTVD